MIADLKPYQEYKESGLPWLGQVPAHWRLVPNRGLVRRRKVLVGRRHSDYRLLSLTKKGVIVRDISTGKGKFSSDMGTSQEVRDGDLVFCLFDVPETPRTVGLSRHDGMITGAYTVFESLGRGSSEYFELFYRAMDDRKLLSPLYSGLRNTISAERLLGTKTPQPSSAEQVAIVRFLGWANWRLEQAIRAKRNVITLLNEQKQATIHCAVTGGLDTSVPLKPSGIPWLGAVPHHWQTRKIKFLVSTIGGMTPNKGVARFWEGRIPWVSPKDMKRREITDSQDHITDSAIRETNISLIPPPAVLIVVRGMILARTFPAAVTTVPVTVNQDMKALTPKPELNADFLVSLLTGIQREILHVVEESGHGTRCLRTDSWANFTVPLPPVREQVRINEHLKSELADVNTTISHLEREIKLLLEYRTRLVSDVVTGKLDVRGAAAALPEEVAPDTTEDYTGLGDEPETAEEEAVV